MLTIDSLDTLLVEQLRDIYDAEKRLTKAIPKLVKHATNEALKKALETHLHETEKQVTRLEQAFDQLDVPAKGRPCAAMRGIIEEGDEHVSEDFADDGLRDATIIGAAQRVEHYEMAAYGNAIAHARLLKLDDVVRLLQETLAEEKAADKRLADIAETVVNLDAAHTDEDSEGDRPSGPDGIGMSRRRAAAHSMSHGGTSARVRESSGRAGRTR